MPETPIVKAVPYCDIRFDRLSLVIYNRMTRELMTFNVRDGETVMLPSMEKGEKEHKAILKLYSKHYLKTKLTLLRSSKPEKLPGMNRYLTENEKIALREGILCVLANDAHEIMPRRAEA